MTWTKLGDDFTDRPEMFRASRSARLLLVEAMVWSNRMLTDGRVPSNVLRRISDSEDLDGDSKALAEAGLWDVDGDEYVIDWTDQENAEDVRDRQEVRNERQRRYRRRKELHARGDHSECDPRFCKSVTRNATRHITRNGDGNEDRHVTPSRPDPSRPQTGTGAGPLGGPSAGATGGRPRPASDEDDARDLECMPVHPFLPGPAATRCLCGQAAEHEKHDQPDPWSGPLVPSERDEHECQGTWAYEQDEHAWSLRLYAALDEPTAELTITGDDEHFVSELHDRYLPGSVDRLEDIQTEGLDLSFTTELTVVEALPLVLNLMYRIGNHYGVRAVLAEAGQRGAS